jgi:hypothetical protein
LASHGSAPEAATKNGATTDVPELNRRGIVLSASIGLDSHDGPDALAAAEHRLAVAVGDTKRIAS